jgi:hypothetical protein
MTARGGTHPPRKVYDIPSPGGTHPPQKVYGEGTVTYLPWERNATLGRSVDFHTVSAGTQKYQNLNLRKPKFTEIWFKSISACALNPLQGTQLYQYPCAKF